MPRTNTKGTNSSGRGRAEAQTKPSDELPSDVLRTPSTAGEMAAEFLGTFVLILFGTGVVAQVVAGEIGDHDSIAWAWGLGVTLGIYTAGRVSGAHLNPAVTVALALFQNFPVRKIAPYVTAQFLGAFFAALVVRWNYTEVIGAVDPGHTIKTQGIFSTLPGNGVLPVSAMGGFRDQIIGTAILVFLVFAITDARNSAPLANLAPLLIGLLVVAIGMAWGTNAGYAINPARDFGPRLATFFTGYQGAFRDQYGGLYWWVPIAGPLIGGIVGGALYKFGLQRFLPAAEPAKTPAA
jgi:glycerol uptake facilitator protein